MIDWAKVGVGTWAWERWTIEKALDTSGPVNGVALVQERYLVKNRDNLKAIRCTLEDAKRYVEVQY